MGAAAAAARGDAEHPDPDAAARAQHGGLHPVPDRGHRRVRGRGRRDRGGHLPDLRRPQRRLPDDPGHRGRPGHGHRGGRGGPVLHRGPAGPGRGPLHPGLLPGAGRPVRRGRGARAGDQGHGRAAAPGRGGAAGERAAGALRAARAPAHPRHRRRAAGHADGRDRGRGGRGGRGRCVHGRDDLPGAGLGAGGGPGAHRARHRDRSGGDLGDGALLGGHPPDVRPVRVRAHRPDRAGVPARDPRRSALEPAPAGHRAGAGGALRGDRGHVHRRQRHAGQAGEGHPLLQGRRRPRPGTGGGRAWTRPSSRRTRRSSTCRTR